MMLSETLTAPETDHRNFAERLAVKAAAAGSRGHWPRRCHPSEDLERAFEQLANIGVTSRYGAGEDMVYEGDAATHLVQLASGFAHESIGLADGRRHIVDFVWRGEFCGLPQDGRHPVTVHAATDVRVIRFPRLRFEEILDETPALARCFAREIERRLHRAQHKLVALGCLDAPQRTALFLKWLARGYRGEAADGCHAGALDHEGGWHPIPVTRRDIGEYLGLSLETVCRSIARLKSLGLVALRDRHHFRILDHDRLDSFIEPNQIWA